MSSHPDLWDTLDATHSTAALELAAELGDRPEVLDAHREEHETPFATLQSFTWVSLRRQG